MSYLFQFMHGLGRFEAWFDGRFGWFFTNGMKKRERSAHHALKA